MHPHIEITVYVLYRKSNLFIFITALDKVLT